MNFLDITTINAKGYESFFILKLTEVSNQSMVLKMSLIPN